MKKSRTKNKRGTRGTPRQVGWVEMISSNRGNRWIPHLFLVFLVFLVFLCVLDLSQLPDTPLWLYSSHAPHIFSACFRDSGFGGAYLAEASEGNSGYLKRTR